MARVTVISGRSSQNGHRRRSAMTVFAACIIGAFAAAAAAQPPPQTAVPPTLRLEFDLPDDFWTRGPDGDYVVTGFQLGYFPVSRSWSPVVVDVPLHTVEVNGLKATIALDRARMVVDTRGVVVRLKSLSREGASLWSEPSPVFWATERR